MLTSKTRYALFQKNVERKIFICIFITLEQKMYYFRVPVMKKSNTKTLKLIHFKKQHGFWHL